MRQLIKKISLSGGVHFLYAKMISPKSIDEDSRRREFILNILLLSLILLWGVFSFFVLHSSITNPEYKGVSFANCSLVFLFFIVLYLLSRARLFVFVSYLFIGMSLCLATYTSYRWGVDVPQALLAYALIIILSGIIISSRFAFFIALIITFSNLILAYLHLRGVIHPELYWKPETLRMNDAIEFSITLLIVAIVSWLSNREIESSLKRARKSEVALKRERDMLEVRVKERTRELEKTQAEKINQATRFIEFGKISSGLFHDMINHITVLFFDIEKANDAGKKEFVQAKKYLKQVNETKDLLSEYIETVKKQFQNQKISSLFSVKKEISNIVKMLECKLKTEKVEISLKSESDIMTYGNYVKFNHVITNIIVNSLDVYRLSDNKKREIEIKISGLNGEVMISIEDWAGGIPEGIRGKIFDPFFTTKGPQDGMGIGLTIVKDIIEEDFKGTINVKSVWGKGSKFIIKFPIRNEPR